MNEDQESPRWSLLSYPGTLNGKHKAIVPKHLNASGGILGVKFAYSAPWLNLWLETMLSSHAGDMWPVQ